MNKIYQNTLDVPQKLFTKRFNGLYKIPVNPHGSRVGFTLIELLVVVLIIGILAAVALPKYQDAVDRSRMVRWLALGRALAQAQDVYYMNNNYFSGSFSQLDIQLPGSAQIYDSSLDGKAGQRAYFNMNRGSSTDSMAGERVRVDLYPSDAEQAGMIQMQVKFTDNHEMWLAFYPKAFPIRAAAGHAVCSGKGKSQALCARFAGGESRRVSPSSSMYYLD